MFIEKDTNNFFKALFNQFENYSEESISPERITHIDVMRLINNLSENRVCTIEEIGKSVEGREIKLIILGKGATKILAWSQMHGDESTATAALFDLLNFFTTNNNLKEFKDSILNRLQIFIIPMLNPDGAERHTRTNAFNIDINRDAVRRQSPESKIFWNTVDKIKPDFGFNLHDQNSYYTAGRTNNTAGISLLAPPTDFEKNLSETRIRSMQVIAKIYETLSGFIPHNIARYNDDYEPRAFGDNLTKTGVSSILIESGFLKSDPKKELVRKLNFISLITALHSISTKDYESVDTKKYFDIPENNQLLFDLLLRNLSFNSNGENFLIDIGINREKIFDSASDSFYFISKIKEIGDLSYYSGIEEHDLKGFSVEIAKTYSVVDNENIVLDDKYIRTLHSDGYGYIRTNKTITQKFTSSPINIVLNDLTQNSLQQDDYANLIINKDGKISHIIVNGFIQDLKNNQNKILNGAVIH